MPPIPLGNVSTLPAELRCDAAVAAVVTALAVPTIGTAIALFPTSAVPTASGVIFPLGGVPAKDVSKAALAATVGVLATPRRAVGIEARAART